MGQGAKLDERCGTLQYVAPEVRAGLSYDEKVDVWSVGSVLFTAMTGAHLYLGGEAEVTWKAKNGLVDFNRRFHRLTWSAQRFLKQLLKVDPECRLSAQDALEEPWLRQHAVASTGVKPAINSKHGIDKTTLVEMALKALTVGVMAVCALDDDDD